MTLVFSLGKLHGQRSLADYSPWVHKRVRHNLVTEQKQQMLTSPILSLISEIRGLMRPPFTKDQLTDTHCLLHTLDVTKSSHLCEQLLFLDIQVSSCHFTLGVTYIPFPGTLNFFYRYTDFFLPPLVCVTELMLNYQTFCFFLEGLSKSKMG